MGTSHQTRGCYTRRAAHAGSWYSSSAQELDAELQQYLDDAGDDAGPLPSARGVVAPHAGYAYSGPTAAFAYRALRRRLAAGRPGGGEPPLRTVVVLHPSHHVRLDGCALSGADALRTPLGDLAVAGALRSALRATGKFGVLGQRVDEGEHSGEMQYPYLRKCLDDAGVAPESVGVLPIMVGSLDEADERAFGELLAPYLGKEDTFTVVSSDFCHWGSRFRYRPFRPEIVPASHRPARRVEIQIFEYIAWLDKTGMDHISMQDPGAFSIYLREHSNTICGRHPIGVWLNAIVKNRRDGTEKLDVNFVRYAQSSHVAIQSDSSVSYASAVATRCDESA